MLRRLEKRVLVDLPSKEAREAMFQQFLPPTVIRENNGLVLFSDLDYVQLSKVYFSLFYSLFQLVIVGYSSAQKVIQVQILN
jgi:katanin p60 ATPase-containing subunit A1